MSYYNICLFLYFSSFVDSIVLGLFSFLTYHLIFNKSSTTDATSGAKTGYPSGAHEFPRF